MIEIARSDYPDIDFRVDSRETLSSVPDGSIDLVIANYVLMDLSGLESAIGAFHRVLHPGGVSVVVFSHPCFPQGRASVTAGEVMYRWSFPYFERRRCVDPPWKHFTSSFIWFHRPLSDYWRAFRAAGFVVEEFEEPVVTDDGHHVAVSAEHVEAQRMRPNSVAFKLRKPT